MPDLADAIDALLPQTQCTKCGYPGCRPYADAIARGEAAINQCPPGGSAGIASLARLLGCGELPLNPVNGTEQPRTAALIDEARCIGCMLCIKACPVDAIVGAAKQMHTVLTGACTGCDLCLPPCPVDCIDMVDLPALQARGNRHAAGLARQTAGEMADAARARFEFRQTRLARETAERSLRLAQKAQAKLAELDNLPPGEHAIDRKKAVIQAALERARRARQKANP